MGANLGLSETHLIGAIAGLCSVIVAMGGAMVVLWRMHSTATAEHIAELVAELVALRESKKQSRHREDKCEQRCRALWISILNLREHSCADRACGERKLVSIRKITKARPASEPAPLDDGGESVIDSRDLDELLGSM